MYGSMGNKTINKTGATFCFFVLKIIYDQFEHGNHSYTSYHIHICFTKETKANFRHICWSLKACKAEMTKVSMLHFFLIVFAVAISEMYILVEKDLATKDKT